MRTTRVTRVTKTQTRHLPGADGAAGSARARRAGSEAVSLSRYGPALAWGERPLTRPRLRWSGVIRPQRRRPGGSAGRSAGRASRPREPRRISSSGTRDRRARSAGSRAAPPTRDRRPRGRRAARRPSRRRARPRAPLAPPSPCRAPRTLRRASREVNASPPSRVEFHLVEETKHGVPGPYPALERAKLVVGRLAQRSLD